jgi:S1-C subfamily serine protease
MNRCHPGSRRRVAMAALAVALVLGPPAARSFDSPDSVPARSSLPAAPAAGADGRQGYSAGRSAADGTGYPRVEPSVVAVYARLPRAVSAGTGIVFRVAVGDSGAGEEVLTNAHVIAGSTSVRVHSLATGRRYSAVVMGADTAHDVALLWLPGTSALPPARLADSDAVQLGQPVAALGNAGGADRLVLAPGHVIAVHRTVVCRDEDGNNPERLKGAIQVDARIVPGDSGGPLLTAQGAVLGVTTAARADTGSGPAGWAIPINAVTRVARELETAHHVPDARRGRSGGADTAAAAEVRDTTSTR